MADPLHTRAWQRTRLYVLNRDGWTCRVPLDEHGQPDEAGTPHGIHLTTDNPTAKTHATVDHIITRHDAPELTFVLANLRGACRDCNGKRAAAQTNARRHLPAINLSRAW